MQAAGWAYFKMRLHAGEFSLIQLTIEECAQLTFGWMHVHLLSEWIAQGKR
jgi:hypothetical protein